jgi:hypothetical protein
MPFLSKNMGYECTVFQTLTFTGYISKTIIYCATQFDTINIQHNSNKFAKYESIPSKDNFAAMV